MHDIDFGRLQFLIAIAECGSMTAAAEKLHLSQPAVSYRLARAEQALGAAIFRREGRELILTPVGKRALTAAQIIENEIYALKKDVAELGGADPSVLRISTQCYTTYQWLPNVIKSVRSEFPEFDVHIVVAATPNPIAALKSNQIDLALTTDASKASKLKGAVILRDEIFAVLPETHALADLPYLTPSQIAREKLILYSSSGSPLVDEFLLPAGKKPTDVSYVPLTEGILELVRSEAGMTSLAGWVLARQDMRGLVRARLGKHGLHRNWRILYKKDRESDLLSKFIAELKRSIEYAV